MEHEDQCKQVFDKGLKGPAMFVVTLSEGSWIDRMVMSAMAYKLFERPANTDHEVQALSNYWEEHADDQAIFDYFGTMPLVRTDVKEADFLRYRDELSKLLP